jgi:hypothetical protein
MVLSEEMEDEGEDAPGFLKAGEGGGTLCGKEGRFRGETSLFLALRCRLGAGGSILRGKVEVEALEFLEEDGAAFGFRLRGGFGIGPTSGVIVLRSSRASCRLVVSYR